MQTGNFPSPLLYKDWNCHQQWLCPRIKPLTEMDGTVQTSLSPLFPSRLSANSCICVSIRHLNFQTLQSHGRQKLSDEKARGNQKKMRIWKNSACQKRPAVHHHCTCAALVWGKTSAGKISAGKTSAGKTSAGRSHSALQISTRGSAVTHWLRCGWNEVLYCPGYSLRSWKCLLLCFP